jgi:hypothetical protein
MWSAFMHQIQRRDCGLEYRRGNYFTRHNLMKTAPEWHLLARPAAHGEEPTDQVRAVDQPQDRKSAPAFTEPITPLATVNEVIEWRFLLRCKNPQVAQTASSRQRSTMPAMEGNRTVGGRGRHSRP